MTQSNLNRRRVLKGAVATTALLAAPPILRAQSGPLRIGVAVPISGPMSFIGNYFLAGIKMASSYYNKSGGLLGREIELVVRDDKFSGAGAIAAAREFSGMGINLQMGGSLTSTTLAVLPILEEINAVFVCIASFTTSITHENFNRRCFRPGPNNYFSGRGLARSAMDRYKNVSRWQVVAGDNALGRDAAKVFGAEVKQYATATGAKTPEVLEPMLVGATQTDFKTQINQLASTGVDGVYTVIPGAAGVAFNRQAVQQAYDKTCKVIVDINGAAIAKELGTEIPANLWGNSYWPRDSEPMKSNKQSQEIYADYVRTTGDKSPSSNSMVSCRSAAVLFEGIKKAKSADVDSAIAAMEGIKFDFLGDPMTVRKEDHQGIGVAYFGQIAAAKNEDGWSFENAVRIPDDLLVEPPTPGQELKI